ncbi:glyoxylate/hydroxypyruvate reductase HPR3 [Coffea eugenioides]|uniref:glyoxylate/hydroxypyruvate reductase HPR3 n=1 Tax=Coffea eugenioides TaxID=49369 RepID=UPI000F60DE23|nr:glyoxylate/hydroxypyruvate reductase HPR3 [Coffea eugenioides]
MAQIHTNQTLSVNLPQVLVLGPPSIFRIYEKHLSQKFMLLKPWESPIPLEEFLSIHAQNTTAVLTSSVVAYLSSALRLLPSVRLVVTSSVGPDHIDLKECRRRGISVAYASSVFSADVADLAVGLWVDVLRKISAANCFLKTGLWPVKGDYPLATKLGGKRVGIIGLGRIGQEVAKRLEAFGCKISYQSREKKPSVSYPFYTDVCELASNSDVLIICCALNDQTYHLINREVLQALGRQGVIINAARGAIIDEKALVQFLQEGKIAGAGLDVFEHEPNVPEELLELDNVVFSPHSAVFTEESCKDLYDLVVGNLEAFFSNKPLLSPVQFDDFMR